MFEKIGDEIATDLVRTVTGKIADHLSIRGGRVLKFLGDGVMAIFESPESAVDACLDLSVAVDAVDVHPQSLHDIAVRVGVDYGTIVEVDNDAYGDIVNVASRILSLAKPGELMMTASVFERLDPVTRQMSRRLGRVYLRGKAVPQLIYGLDLTLDETGESITQFGDESDTTSTSKKTSWHDGSSSFIMLNYEGVDHQFCAEQMPIVIGRSIECDLIVPDARVSRTHVRLDWIAGQFYLTDISINGTMVQYGGSTPGTPYPLSMRRQRCTLTRSGFIFLGLLDRHALEVKDNRTMPPLLHFQVMDKEQEGFRL